MDALTTSFWVGAAAAGDFVVLLAVLYVARAFYGWSFKVNLDNEINKKENIAVGVGMGGYLVGIVIASSGALLSVGDSSHKAMMIAAVGLVSVILMRLSIFFNDKMILPKFKNMEEIIEKRNVGIAFIEAGSCLATGLMIYGIMTGPASSLAEKVLTGMEYWMWGQLWLIIGSWLYHLVCGFDVNQELHNQHNLAAGISMCGFLTSIGFILEAAMHNVSTNVPEELMTSAVFSVMGFVLLTLTKFIIDKVLAHGATGKEIASDGNVGAGLLSAIGFICIGLMFSASITPATNFAALENKVKEIQEEQPAPVPVVETKPANNSTDLYVGDINLTGMVGKTEEDADRALFHLKQPANVSDEPANIDHPFVVIWAADSNAAKMKVELSIAKGMVVGLKATRPEDHIAVSVGDLEWLENFNRALIRQSTAKEETK